MSAFAVLYIQKKATIKFCFVLEGVLEMVVLDLFAVYPALFSCVHKVPQ